MLARYDNVYAGLGRILLGLYFVVPGISKIVGYAGTLALMQTKGVPLAELLLPVTIVMQVGLGALLMFNQQVRISALLLFGLTIIINLYIHNFWDLAGDPGQAHETQNFVKNLAIAAGLLVLAGRSQKA
ncbi:MAG: DoxX family protein [Arenicella sp.]|jgi:putative oxidoreductase|nr:DoxX family protein [Arenicella sp.]